MNFVELINIKNYLKVSNIARWYKRALVETLFFKTYDNMKETWRTGFETWCFETQKYQVNLSSITFHVFNKTDVWIIDLIFSWNIIKSFIQNILCEVHSVCLSTYMNILHIYIYRFKKMNTRWNISMYFYIPKRKLFALVGVIILK